MSKLRTEKDLLGEMKVPSDVLYGIQTLRAVKNFPLSGRHVNPALIHAYGLVKLACAMTNHELGKLENKKFEAIRQACEEMASGKLAGHIIVDALQGGAGTSTNMNVNEVLANRALIILGKKPGDYKLIHPLGDINLHQSTNDTYPTALKVAAISQQRILEKKLVALLESFQNKEKEFAHVVKVGRTEYQDAVLTTMGRTMSAYAEAFGRDRWRVFKCEERLRVVNLGGTAIGTGISAPRQYIFKVFENLKNLTGFGLARAENLVDATQNNDAFVEASGILKACAVNLVKVSNDLRFMSSGPDAGIGELILPACQPGSTVMPGKINPVIPEAVIQAALKAMSNDTTIAHACAMGHLELNAFMPLLADSYLESLDLLINSSSILCVHCIEGLKVNEGVCRRLVENSTATLTALVGRIGYEKAQEITCEFRKSKKSIREIVVDKKILSAKEFNELTSAEAVMKLGS
ncbi:MAG TPA: aspartate ammonia-lyase [Lentisphaeria bacterium]|nr:MAG: aspartate ammonia-lyase [Lentisphaerae bacterium GWF2_49_21]HBC86551.1 aspartate ammonia-lyase [Lentisphaeria bacterium]